MFVVEPLFKRMQRIVVAGVGGAADAAERLTGGAMMRQAIREVDQMIDALHKRLDTARTTAARAGTRHDAASDEAAQRGLDAAYAFDKGRDDLARVAVTRQLELEAEMAEAKAERAAALDQAKGIEAEMADLKARREQMERDHTAVQAAKRAVAAAGSEQGTERKVQRAEAAFARAKSAVEAQAGPVGSQSAPELGEIDAARREDAIEARLAALRGGAPVSSGKGKRKAA